MKETLQPTDPLKEQKEELLALSRPGERLVPIIARETHYSWSRGYKMPERIEKIPVGYVLVDAEVEEQEIMLTETPELRVTVEWQGEQLKKDSNKWRTVSPVHVYEQDRYSGREKEILVGWRIHTEEEISPESKQLAREAIVTALSERLEEKHLENYSDAELYVMMLLMLNKDVQLVRRIGGIVTEYNIGEPLHTLVEMLIKKSEETRRWEARQPKRNDI